MALRRGFNGISFRVNSHIPWPSSNCYLSFWKVPLFAKQSDNSWLSWILCFLLQAYCIEIPLLLVGSPPVAKPSDNWWAGCWNSSFIPVHISPINLSWTALILLAIPHYVILKFENNNLRKKYPVTSLEEFQKSTVYILDRWILNF